MELQKKRGLNMEMGSFLAALDNLESDEELVYDSNQDSVSQYDSDSD